MERLSKYERETIINFNEGDNEACIFTYNKIWQKHLEQKLGLVPVMDNGSGGKEYRIDKKRIKPPRAPINRSFESKRKSAEGLARARFFSQKTSSRTGDLVGIGSSQ